MHKTISTFKAPAAIGPYSQANQIGNLIITSGQLPIDMETGEFPDGIEAQTEKSLLNIRSILEAAGSSMDNVIKTTVFLKSMDDFSLMNKVYAGFFTNGTYPSRSAVEVACLPKGALVEIEAIAYAE